MAIITDFDLWLSGADPDNHEEVFEIYNAVKNVEDIDIYKCTSRETVSGIEYFLQCKHVDEALKLTEKSRKYFLDFVEQKYAGKDLDIESWYNFKVSMSKDD